MAVSTDQLSESVDLVRGQNNLTDAPSFQG